MSTVELELRNIQTPKTMMECGLRQLGSGEDFVFNGMGKDREEGEEMFKCILVMDGHGGPSCINIIKNTAEHQLIKLIGHRDPIKAIASYIRMYRLSYEPMSGATISLAKIYKNRVCCYNVGDSRTFVFLDKRLVYTNTTHDMNNKTDLERLVKHFEDNGEKYAIHLDVTPSVLSPTEITMISKSRIVLPIGTLCALTQSLGHHDGMGYAPEVSEIFYTEEQDLKVLVASDGLFDIMNLHNGEELDLLANCSVDELLDFAEERWKQPWNFNKGGKIIEPNVSFPSFDDVGIAIYTSEY